MLIVKQGKITSACGTSYKLTASVPIFVHVIDLCKITIAYFTRVQTFAQ
ncbi:hypothetical protein L291_3123 [Acinetobacter guillouiae MSP4-18]|nr:hypothetical protein L291_3123 [Acinetobacter guillouiae MSP4-18]